MIHWTTWAHLKLAVSIQTQPILTWHLSASANVSAKVDVVLEEHGRIRSGATNPLSLANCSRQMGRNSVSETITNTSLKGRMIRARSIDKTWIVTSQKRSLASHIAFSCEMIARASEAWD